LAVNTIGEIDAYLDDTTTPLGTLSRLSLPHSNANQLRFGSNSAQVIDNGRFMGDIDVYAYAVDDDILHSTFAHSPPTVAGITMSATTLLADNASTYSVSFSATHFNGAANLTDMHVVFHNEDEWATDNKRGHLAWGLTDEDITSAGWQWTIVGDATGGGRWGWHLDDCGSDTYVTPVAASTSVSGNQRTVTFTFKVKPAWEPAPGQTLYVYAADDFGPATGWVQAPIYFNVILMDYDGDQDIDQEDFGHFQTCLSGPGVTQADPDCQNARLDNDDDVDADDFGIFQRCMNGPNIAAEPNCAG
jgi:hypothetical protein